jgi:hypothetical protein
MQKFSFLNLSGTILSFPGTSAAKTTQPISLAGTITSVVCFLGIIHILVGLLLYYTTLPAFLAYVDEDGYIEYLTAFFLLMTSFFCLYKSFTTQSKIPAAFCSVMAILFFFGFGEEISWGQRLFGFETPAELKRVNSQQEFNVHNVMVGGVKLNKLIFGKIMYLGLFFYILVFNRLYKSKTWFRQLIDTTGIPLPAPGFSLFFGLSFLAVLLIQHGEKWELDEFAIAIFAFLCFFQPYNKKLPQQLAGKTTLVTANPLPK